jgi:hypothetical protein
VCDFLACLCLSPGKMAGAAWVHALDRAKKTAMVVDDVKKVGVAPPHDTTRYTTDTTTTRVQWYPTSCSSFVCCSLCNALTFHSGFQAQLRGAHSLPDRGTLKPCIVEHASPLLFLAPCHDPAVAHTLRFIHARLHDQSCRPECHNADQLRSHSVAFRVLSHLWWTGCHH